MVTFAFDEGASTTTLGAAWTNNKGTFGRTADGKAYNVDGADDGLATVDTGTVNMDVSAVITVTAGSFWGLVLSYVDTANYVWVEVNPNSGAWFFSKKEAGVVSQVAGSVTPGTVTGDVVRAERINGNQYRFYKNGVQVAASGTNQTMFATSTRAGIRHGTNGISEARWDDFTYVSTGNATPTANAGSDESAVVGQVVTLTGSGTDTDGTIASYTWTLPTRPAGSAAALSGAGATRTFTADVAGTYVASLTVTDNSGATSAADTVSITATAQSLTGPHVRVAGAYVQSPATLVRVNGAYVSNSLSSPSPTKPTATNTGNRIAVGSLTPYGSATVSENWNGFNHASGQTYSGIRYLCGLDINNGGSNLDAVTFVDCTFEGGLSVNTCGLTLQNCTFTKGLFMGMGLFAWKIDTCLIETTMGTAATADALRLDRHGSISGSNASTPGVLSNSFVRSNGTPSSQQHADGFQMRGGRDISISNTWFEVNGGGSTQGVNSAVYLESANGGLTNITMTECTVKGGGYVFSQGASSSTFTNNTVVTVTGSFGEWYPFTDRTGNVYNGNVDKNGAATAPPS